MSNEKLRDLYISESVHEIKSGEYFADDTIRSIHLGPNVEIVRQGAFASCPNLEFIECCPNTVFENYVFNNSKKIKSIKCGDATFKVVYLPSHAFFMGILTEKQKKYVNL